MGRIDRPAALHKAYHHDAGYPHKNKPIIGDVPKIRVVLVVVYPASSVNPVASLKVVRLVFVVLRGSAIG
jgi:hypothetical protein